MERKKPTQSRTWYRCFLLGHMLYVAYSIFVMWKIYNIKFISYSFLSVQSTAWSIFTLLLNHHHCFQTFSSSRSETVYFLAVTPHSPLPPGPVNLYSTVFKNLSLLVIRDKWIHTIFVLLGLSFMVHGWFGMYQNFIFCFNISLYVYTILY